MKILKLFSVGILFSVLCISCFNETQPPVDGHMVEKPAFKTDDDTVRLRNYMDKKGLRQGRWTFYGRDKKDSSYAPGAKWREGIYVDSKEEGMWIEYFPNGRVKKEINYRRGVVIK